MSLRSEITCLTVFSLWLLTGPIQADEPSFAKWNDPTLPNAIQVDDGVVSGGQPAGDAGFAALAARGIRTVISVDGMKPEVALARKHGLRYVHLPHGYDQVPQKTGRSLAKAIESLPKPIYIHCHHGRHRSPAAAAVGCIQAGRLTTEQGMQLLQTARTGEEYGGLYRSVQAAQPLDHATLANEPADFPAVVQLPPVVDHMVDMQHSLDQLMSWQKPEPQRAAASATNVDPGPNRQHETAVLLMESLKEFDRSQATQQRPEPWRELTSNAISKSQQLIATYTRSKAESSEVDPRAKRRQLLEQIRTDCRGCHRQFRN
ncbi:MAG: hypothetical protein Fues2KO_36590 [Fuerstiella sp.]